MSRRTRVFGVLVVAAVAGLLGAACSGGGSSNSASGAGGGLAARQAPAGPSVADRASGTSSQSLRLNPAAAPNAVRLPTLQAKVIKTATLSMVVRKGTFGQGVQDATLVASRHGGYVASSESSSGRIPSGTLVLRIPASQFEAAMGELRALGRVRSQKISGQDVTSQFVDLQARLRNWQAQEAVLLRLMSQSTTITDSLRVQNQLQDVQLQIEEIQGQLRVLGDQTDLSTITLGLTEPPPVAAPAPKPSFARAWNRAAHGVAVVFAGIIVAAGYVAPVALLALAGMLGWAGYRRLRPRTVPSA